jgi:hypothetical protein
MNRRTLAVAFLVLLAIPGCATLQQMAALHSVRFEFARVSDVRIAGIPIGENTSFRSLSIAHAAQLAAAVVRKEVPLEMIAHVQATNPEENAVTARMVALDWNLFIEDRQALAGGLGNPVTISPGVTADVPLTVHVDLVQLGSGGARDLFDLGLAIAGRGTLQKDLRIELAPTIETPLGPMRYAMPVTVRRSTDVTRASE